MATVRQLLCVVVAGLFSLSADAVQADDPIRVLIWDEQQPEQKQAYGDRFLGETIAEALRLRPGLQVRSASLRDPQQGLSAEQLDQTDVLVVWSHIRVREQDDGLIEGVVQRVQSGKLGLVAIHSAHWHKAFVRLMQERAKSDAIAVLSDAERQSVVWEYTNESPYGRAVKDGDRRTPFVERGAGNIRKLTLPQCVFPAWRPDGAASHVTTKLPEHPMAAGLPKTWDIPHTEMYGEPFHVPEPDEVVFEERWDKGEYFRSGCVWRVGAGRVFYFRPGHELFPIFLQKEPLQVIENAVRWLGRD